MLTVTPKYEYRVKKESWDDLDAFFNTLNCEVPPQFNVYLVQVRRYFTWVTLKAFSGHKNDTLAKKLADDLLETLKTNNL